MTIAEVLKYLEGTKASFEAAEAGNASEDEYRAVSEACVSVKPYLDDVLDLANTMKRTAEAKAAFAEKMKG